MGESQGIGSRGLGRGDGKTAKLTGVKRRLSKIDKGLKTPIHISKKMGGSTGGKKGENGMGLVRLKKVINSRSIPLLNHLDYSEQT